jgi:ABC-type Mn2+/Zn2+ transport system ATPase subunit
MQGLYLPYGRRRHVEGTPDAPAVLVRQLRAGHPGADTDALEGIDLSVPSGSRAALVGSNGAGKSTLLKAIAGLLPIRSGQIFVFGKPVGVCHQRVAYLPQRGDLDWRFPVSVRRLVLTGRYVHLGWLRRPSRADWAIADEMLEQLGIADLADRQIGELSGGQQQRALFARALAQQADLLLLDEPLNAVDTNTREVIANVLEKLHQQGKTFIIATHDLGRLEADFDQALYLSGGHIVPPPPGSFVAPALQQEIVWTGS